MNKNSCEAVFCSGKGFTLIELLVVVLIIGILAAVALPQYNKAVKKSQGAEALVALDALDKAFTNYYLEHGTYEGMSVEKLNIELPELHHFKYGMMVNADPIALQYASFKFRDTDFQLYASGGRVVTSLGNNDIRIEFSHAWGKIISRWCYPYSGSPTSCADYFNCKETPRTQLGVGCYKGGNCSL